MSDHKPLIRNLFLLFFLSFLLTFPTFFFSVDELSYCSRALAFAMGQPNLLQMTVSGNTFSWAPADYPIGTSALLTIFAFCSKHLIFLSGLLYSSIAGYLSYLILKKEQTLHYFPFLIALLFPPTIYFSRGLMSEMPSLLLIAFFTYSLFNHPEKHRKYFLLGLLTGCSILFRETNIVLCGALVILSLFRSPKYILSFVPAMLLGFLPRIFSANFFYENIGYVKKYAPFGIEYFSRNLPLYLMILLVLLPGGLYVLYRYKGKFANSIKLAIITFTLLHLVYGYNSGDHSGTLISLFYNGRYYIPTLPLWIIVYASFSQSISFLNKKTIKNALLVLGFAFISGTQFFYYVLEKKHKAVATKIFEKYNDTTLLYDNTAYRYLNPLHGSINQLEVLKDIKKGKAILKEKAYLVLSHRNNSNQQLKLWDNQLQSIQHLRGQLKIQQVENYTIFDGTNIVIFELSPLSE